MTVVEGSIYVPKIDWYLQKNKTMYFCGIIDSSEVNYGKNFALRKLIEQNGLFICEINCNAEEDLDEYYQLTYQFLVDKYEVKGVTYEQTIDFEEYSYIKDFIMYLAELQIEQNGKHLQYDEMIQAIADFCRQNQIKPKTKVKE